MGEAKRKRDMDEWRKAMKRFGEEANGALCCFIGRHNLMNYVTAGFIDPRARAVVQGIATILHNTPDEVDGTGPLCGACEQEFT